MKMSNIKSRSQAPMNYS